MDPLIEWALLVTGLLCFIFILAKLFHHWIHGDLE